MPSELEPTPFGEVEIVRSPSGKLLRELSLVLNAVDIPHRRLQGSGYQSLFVPAAQAERALEELSAYQRENRAWPPARPSVHTFRGGALSALFYATVLALAFRLSTVQAFGVDWYAAGRVDGARIRAGEWWRGMTGLFLHSDFVHLASNLVFGTLFGILLAQVHGPGLAWLCILLAGLAGNLVNSWVQGFDNYAVGASTAVFAALGALAAAQAVRKLRMGHGSLAQWAPVFVAALLLGWHGMGSTRIEPGRGIVRDPGDRTDVGAHIAGFLCGLGLGALLAVWRARGEVPHWAQRAAAVGALVLPLAGWALALWARG